LVFAEGGVVKCCLKDRQAGLVTFLTARTWDQLLQQAEDTLFSGEGDWRVSREQKSGRR
jgi:hypothetical protein